MSRLRDLLPLFILIGLSLGCADGLVDIDDQEVETPRGDPPDSDKTEDQRTQDPNCIDTPPLSTQGIAGFSAATRITSMQVPVSRNQAIQYGCDLVAGSNGGIGLSVLIRAMNIDLDTLFAPGSDGIIPSVVLGHLVGWEPGQTSNNTDDLELRMYAGAQDPSGGFSLHESAYNSEGAASVSWPAVLGCGQLQTEPGPLSFALPSEASGLSARLNLGAAQVSADISIDARGFSIDGGTISGYVPLHEIVSIVSRIQDGCRAPNPPELCAQTGSLLQGDPAQLTRDLVLPFLHGLDARLSDDPREVDSCTGDDCNAMSVCVRIESEGALIVE